MTSETKASLRAISEKYVRSQIDSKVPKKDINSAIKKVNAVLLELEKAKAIKQT